MEKQKSSSSTGRRCICIKCKRCSGTLANVSCTQANSHTRNTDCHAADSESGSELLLMELGWRSPHTPRPVRGPCGSVRPRRSVGVGLPGMQPLQGHCYCRRGTTRRRKNYETGAHGT